VGAVLGAHPQQGHVNGSAFMKSLAATVIAFLITYAVKLPDPLPSVITGATPILYLFLSWLGGSIPMPLPGTTTVTAQFRPATEPGMPLAPVATHTETVIVPSPNKAAG
jgi:hypothetical protein